MSAMHMPGFTAEASLYQSEGRYQVVTTATGSLSPALVLPQGVTCVNYCDGSGDCGYVECTIMGDDPGGWGVNFGGDQDQRNCARCKAACYRGPANKRQACLAVCADGVC